MFQGKYNSHARITLPSLGGFQIHISNVSLSNFRNYSHLDLNLPSGLTVLEGKNGHGKSNLLEAIYTLSVAKSPRTILERDIVNKQSLIELKDGLSYAMVGANLHSGGKTDRLEIHYRCQPAMNDDGFKAQKFIRINGTPKRSLDLIGLLNAVLFTVEDLDLIYGRPSARRRYLDILVSQVNKNYFQSLRRYQKAIAQRNHLLRMIKNNLSSISELEFWDEKLSVDGSVVISERIKAVNELSFEAQGVHSAMSGVEEMLSFQYKPSVNILDNVNKDQISKSLLESLANFRGKDISRGATQLGPHRDDMRTLVNGTDAERYASRGQARTAVLSLKMAEARFLLKRRGNEPILLMDDFLSELDSIRRNQVIEHTLQYEQCIITTSEPDSIPIKFGKTSNKLIVSEGNIISSGGTT